jgi:Cu(I)/Ag(I) efflux system membrane fusion protein
MRKLIGILLIAGAVAGAFFLGRKYSTRPAAAEGRKILYWYDPMHPAYRSDKPGIAPDCGMQLEPRYAGEGPAAAKPQGKVLHYRDPQDATYHSDKPGVNPATGRDLEPVYEQPAPGTVEVSTGEQQLIGVRSAEVQRSAGIQTIRANGKIAIDETRVARVQARSEGWIDKVMINFTGDRVTKGQPLLTIYSPELVATQQEYLLALKARGILHHTDTGSLIEASRLRLEHWNMTPEQIAEVERTGKPTRNLTLYSPASGYVTVRNAFPNQRITPETELYTIVDLDRVWILADVFESDAPLVRLGQTARVSLPYLGGRTMTARVAYILPQVDPQTRTLKVRLEADNPATLLKPEMFVDVEFQASLGASLSVPAEAVLDAGLTKTVFVDKGNGSFEPRQVRTGRRFNDRIEILSGLRQGERVAASGAFLLDSESQMKAPAAEHQHD